MIDYGIKMYILGLINGAIIAYILFEIILK